MTFWCGTGSGSADPMFLTNGSGSFYFHYWPSWWQQKINLKKVFYRLLFKDSSTSFFKKKTQNSGNQSFSYYFCLMIEGSGSIPLTNGSGSRRPKNMWIRIRNTGFFYTFSVKVENIYRLLLFNFVSISNQKWFGSSQVIKCGSE